MSATLVPDGLWDMIKPLLPLPKPKPQGGRPRIPDRDSGDHGSSSPVSLSPISARIGLRVFDSTNRVKQ